MRMVMLPLLGGAPEAEKPTGEVQLIWVPWWRAPLAKALLGAFRARDEAELLGYQAGWLGCYLVFRAGAEVVEVLEQAVGRRKRPAAAAAEDTPAEAPQSTDLWHAAGGSGGNGTLETYLQKRPIALPEKPRVEVYLGEMPHGCEAEPTGDLIADGVGKAAGFVAWSASLDVRRHASFSRETKAYFRVVADRSYGDCVLQGTVSGPDMGGEMELDSPLLSPGQVLQVKISVMLGAA